MEPDKGHVLVVDDDPLNRKLLAKNLERDGHRPTAVENGFDALKAMENDPPDVVLLDIVMPGLDGIEVLARMKESPNLLHIPVIMISGVDDSESVVRCIETGAEDFLPKPFDPVILRARIAAGLNRKRLYDVERERVRNVFTRFLPEPIAAEMLARSDGEPSIRPIRLWGTVMFADLRGFTTVAESRSPEEVIKLLDRYQGAMGDAVMDHGGTLIDFMGDGLMAVFGAPIETIDHADRAVSASREMTGPRLAEFNEWLREARLAEGFRMGIGLNSGRLMSGTLGSERRIDYAVIGDTVNTASRIEQLTKDSGRAILISDQTKTNMTGQTNGLVFVDEFEIRGKQSRIKLWSVDEPAGSE